VPPQQLKRQLLQEQQQEQQEQQREQREQRRLFLYKCCARQSLHRLERLAVR
jgi:hypothetical protein